MRRTPHESTGGERVSAIGRGADLTAARRRREHGSRTSVQMRSSGLEGLGRRSLAGASLCLVAGVALAGCSTSTLDMRALHQPVLLNSNPIAGSGPELPSSTGVDTYSAVVSTRISAAGAGGSSSSSYGQVNQPQVAAFGKIGGDPSLAITDVSVDVDFSALNLIFALMTDVTLTLNGSVQRFAVSGAPATGGGQ